MMEFPRRVRVLLNGIGLMNTGEIEANLISLNDGRLDSYILTNSCPAKLTVSTEL